MRGTTKPAEAGKRSEPGESASVAASYPAAEATASRSKRASQSTSTAVGSNRSGDGTVGSGHGEAAERDRDRPALEPPIKTEPDTRGTAKRLRARSGTALQHAENALRVARAERQGEELNVRAPGENEVRDEGSVTAHGVRRTLHRARLIVVKRKGYLDMERAVGGTAPAQAGDPVAGVRRTAGGEARDPPSTGSATAPTARGVARGTLPLSQQAQCTRHNDAMRSEAAHAVARSQKKLAEALIALQETLDPEERAETADLLLGSGERGDTREGLEKLRARTAEEVRTARERSEDHRRITQAAICT